MKKLTKEEVLESFEEKHGNYFTYPDFEYINTKQKIVIVCPVHGEFNQVIKEHKSGVGCQKCSATKSNNRTRKTTEQFIEESVNVHGDLYNYSKVDYKRRDEKVVILCPVHGEFEQQPASHLSGVGCPSCGREKSDLSRRKTTEQFIEESVSVHGDLYDYSKTKYVLAKEKVEVICKEHGIFLQKPNDHLNGHGCPDCNESLGEKKVRRFLEKNSISFESEKLIEGCSGERRTLPFDFYLTNSNTLIEYDGIQHFISFEHFGGEEKFEKVKTNDKIKTDFCKNNGIRLIRIPYIDFDRIEDILREELNLTKIKTNGKINTGKR